MCIKIPADNEKCVELLIIDNIWMEFRDCDKNLVKTVLYFDRCDDQCDDLWVCTFTNKHNEGVEHYDILDLYRGAATCMNESRANGSSRGPWKSAMWSKK